MPKFLETKLKQQYGEKSAIPYKIMNSIGAMHGNKETAKGKAMEKKHESRMREMRIEIHRGKDNAVTGHTVHHHMMPRSTGRSGAFMEETHHSFPFGPKDHAAMMEHIAEHIKGPMKAMAHKVAESEAEEPDEA